jgi:hypothetical protein
MKLDKPVAGLADYIYLLGDYVYTMKQNTETVASKKVGSEVKAEKAISMLLPHHQTAG